MGKVNELNQKSNKKKRLTRSTPVTCVLRSDTPEEIAQRSPTMTRIRTRTIIKTKIPLPQLTLLVLGKDNDKDVDFSTSPYIACATAFILNKSRLKILLQRNKPDSFNSSRIKCGQWCNQSCKSIVCNQSCKSIVGNGATNCMTPVKNLHNLRAL